MKAGAGVWVPNTFSFFDTISIFIVSKEDNTEAQKRDSGSACLHSGSHQQGYLRAISGYLRV